MSDECCSMGGPVSNDPPEVLWKMRTVQNAVAAGLFVAVGLVAGITGADRLELVAFTVALVVGGSTFVPETLRALLRGRLGVGTLMTIAAVGATALGELGEAASLAFLFSISEALEQYALARTRRGLRALLDLVPEVVSVRRDGADVEVAPGALLLGDVMLVRPGDRVATDGVVRQGRSTLDLSAITGESVPVEANPGDVVYAASINGGGALDIEVTALSADSSLARIVRVVEDAQERKGNSQRLADRIAKPLVPGIIIFAFAIAVVGSVLGSPALWIERALVVLVAAAPCAFAISVPVTVVAAIGAATKNGALVKGGLALEALAQISIVALDKTGTLTQNRPQVIEVIAAPGSDREDVLASAASLEARSDHPLAGAILAAVASPRPASDVQAVVGRGLIGTLDGDALRLGKPGYITAGALLSDVERLQDAGATVVLVERNATVIGAIAVRDELRPEAPAAVASLRQSGVDRVVMLTGDNKRTAGALGRAAGVDSISAELLPEDKARIVTELQASGQVAMVGDGINDAPALATAHVGIAMGAMGSDVAIEAADVSLLGEDLRHLPELLVHARRAGRIMRQNLFMSGAIIATLIPLGGFGVLRLATVVATHEIAEVFVIANGVRAGRRKQSAAASAARPMLDREPFGETSATLEAKTSGVR